MLLTAKADDQVNSMTISWGMLGIEWGRPVFVTFLREHRFTKELIDKNGEFTVNIPYGQDAKEILNFCGTKSGRDVDKFHGAGTDSGRIREDLRSGDQGASIDPGVQSGVQAGAGSGSDQ